MTTHSRRRRRLSMLTLSAIVGTLVSGAASAPAGADICVAFPGVSVTAIGGQCIRHVVPAPATVAYLERGTAPPEGAVPARELGPDEPAPNWFLDPITDIVYHLLPDGRVVVYTPLAQPPEPPAEEPGGDDPVVDEPAVLPPAAPPVVSARRADGAAVVSWRAPLDDGGAPITTWQVRAYFGGDLVAERLVPATARSAVVPHLGNGVEHAVTVAGVNAAGAGPEAGTTVVPAARPGRPLILGWAAGSKSAALRWEAPDTGGADIVRWTIRTYRGGALVRTTVVAPGATRTTVSGLAPGARHSFTVTAVNEIGASPVSPRSGVVVPKR